jgi:hypothetical protein
LPSAFFLDPSSFATYSTRSQSSNVRWVCGWRDVILIGRRTVFSAASWMQAVGSKCSFTGSRRARPGEMEEG